MNPGQHYQSFAYSELMKQHVVIPEWQRITSKNHVQEIFEAINHYLDQYKVQPILPGCITVCRLASKSELIMVDGQHRFLAMKRLFDECNIDITVMCCVLSIEKEEDAHHWFTVVNATLPLTRIPSQQRLTIPNRVAEQWCQRYPHIFSDSDRPRRPHINKSELASRIAVAMGTMPELATQTSDFILTKFTEYNQWLGTQPLNTFRYPGDSDDTLRKYLDAARKKGGCWFGMFKQYEFVKRCFQPTTSVINSSYKKTPIPKRLHTEVWKKFNGNSLIGKCYACDKEIEKDDSQAGHILAESKGGLTVLSNLQPVCAACNASCHTRHLEEFKALLK